MKKFNNKLVILIVFSQLFASAQNEAMNWYFGSLAGLSFSTSPPTILTNGVLTTNEGCATISGPSGNLLFYTDGSTVWNSSHVVMANGTGLNGNSSTTQSALIVRQPGSSTIYHVFSLGSGGSASLCCSTVDMSLASGSGSVTVKNVFLASGMTEKLTGSKHCNGVDYWAITHEGSTNNFQAFLVTSAGVSLTPVISATGPSNIGGLGTLKSSPNGRMLASSRNVPSSSTAAGDLFSFDQTTGQVVFQYPLTTGLGSYGCEFSPDGTKLYVAGYVGSSYNLAQFDLCAGTETAVAASMYTMACTSIIGAMQVAPDGKVYCARPGQQSLGVINNPNAVGALCNFVEAGQSIAPKSSQLGLPNFAIAYSPSLAPFTYSTTCNTATFTAPPIVQTSTVTGCIASGYSMTSLQWNFGDVNSGAANISTILNPQHAFSAPGTYTTTLIVSYSCGRANDTLRQAVSALGSSPSLSVAGTFAVCRNEVRTYTASGANSYTWSNGVTGPMVTITHTTNMILSVVASNTTGSCDASQTFTIVVRACLGIDDLSDEQIKLYPNPANEILNIETDSKTTVLLLNYQGQILKNETFERGKYTLDLSTYEDGIYFLKTRSESGVTSRRLVKSR